jgi:sodium transport system permease protein
MKAEQRVIGFWRQWWLVFRKELVDALRDKRTLTAITLSTLIGAPLMLFVMSKFVTDIEAKADRRIVYAVGIEAAPGLRNYLERQNWRIETAPEDYEAQLRSARFGEAVLVVPAGFEDALREGKRPALQVVSDGANRQSGFGARPLQDLLRGYLREVHGLNLALRGVAPDVVNLAEIESVDLASAQARASSLIGMLPFMVLMAMIYGAITAALDTTAGERERGSLEPLLLNPVPSWSLAAGKWAAVTVLCLLMTLASSASFIPSQALIGSESLAANFQFGWREVGAFMILLGPLCGAISALMMALAIHARTVKEAQANVGIVMLVVSLVPMMTMMQDGGERAWHLWLPVLGQNVMMLRALRGEGLAFEQVAIPALVAVMLTLALLAVVGRAMKHEAVRG